MSINFNLYRLVDVPEHLKLSLGSANGQDLLDALGIEETYSDTPWSINCFRALVTLARRERLDDQSPVILPTDQRILGSYTSIDCGKPEGYIERRLSDLSDLPGQGIEVGATSLGWG